MYCIGCISVAVCQTLSGCSFFADGYFVDVELLIQWVSDVAVPTRSDMASAVIF